MAKRFHLPDGIVTTSATDYAAAWDELISFLETQLQLKVYAFGPDLACQDALSPAIPTMALPVWFVRRLMAAMEKTK